MTFERAAAPDPSRKLRRAFSETPSGPGAEAAVWGTKGQNARRPKIASRAGSRVRAESAAKGDAHRRDRPEAGCPVDLGQRQAEQSGDHGQGGGEDRRAGRGEGDAHRLVLVVVAVQLLAISGDQQKGIVGPGAEDEDRHDRARLPVDGDAELCQAVAERTREQLGEDHRDERIRKNIGER